MMMNYFTSAFLIVHCIHIFECKDECSKTICNPKAGDLLIGRESFLTTSSTCGLSEFETYCVVTPSDHGIKKSNCHVCYSKNPYQTFSSRDSHRIENVVSRLPQDSDRWWQSENGKNNVSIEISFESEFQFTYTQLRFKTYRPAAMYIERSKDYGRSWQKYGYFSDSCGRDFPNIPERKRYDINDVVCTSEFSKISPSEDGTVLFSAVSNDWYTSDILWNKERNDITAITNLRVQFVRLHTFGDLKIDHSPTIINKYYYAISEWIIRGRCSCYGHASRCKPKEGQIQISEMVYGVCECEHNTRGQHCEKCADFYNDSPWLPADKKSTNACRKCNCNDHATSCHYNSALYSDSQNKSGGHCDNCQHNTEGVKCEYCKSGFYRNSLVAMSSPNTCLKCQCNSQGTVFPHHCIQESNVDGNKTAGSCKCKENIDGKYCDNCKIGFWKFNAKDEKGCTKCKCLMMGTIKNQGCDSINGNCYCKTNVMNDDCSICKNGYYNLSVDNPDGCSRCKCSEYGSLEKKSCDKFGGQCHCKNGYTGKTCDKIKAGWYVDKPRFPMKKNEFIRIELPQVDKSAYYNLIITMDTQQMQIFDTYLISIVVGHEKSSSCQDYQESIVLIKDTKSIVIPNKCLEKDQPISISIYTIEEHGNPVSSPAVMEIIVVPMLDVNSTKTRLVLADCLKYNQESIPKHCEFLRVTSSELISNSDVKECSCNVTGSTNNVCNRYGGQCHCLPNVSGKNCDQCVRDSYGFDARGCKMCNCDPTGSLNLQCSSDTGKCLCRNSVEGRHCDSCKSGYWNFPYCDSCKCNRLSELCDQKTGRCLNCRENSFGFNCQQCEQGYYGDPSHGISCSKCDCPSNIRNNSIGCSLIFNTTTYFCICKPGYTGQFCNKCDINYFGNPLDKDGSCHKCTCSSNINNLDPDSCNTRTGECTKCLYNTAGFNCEKCAPGYFGSGLSRTCKKCVCNQLGTNLKSEEMCNQETGKCPCLSNVMGQQCDRCRNGSYNISSGMGCSPCQCDFPIGAVNEICNKLTGQCRCHSSRSGLRCDGCQDGYWGDPRVSQGCKECICNSQGSLFKQCDRNNGKCRCKTGVTGRYCDKCMKGTDGDMPKCDSCGTCWLDWDNIIENVERSVYNINNDSLIIQRRVQYPKEITFIFNSMTEYLNLSKSIMDYFPPGFEIVINGIELKFLEIRNMFAQLNLTEFEVKQFDYIYISNRINLAKELVVKNKIKDFEGANNEIRKSLSSVSAAISEIIRYSNKINFMRINLSDQNEDLKKIQIDHLYRKNKELDDLSTTMLKNLKTFNGVTCNLKVDSNLLNCSEICGGVGCEPNMCNRTSPINPHCIMGSSPFFNSFARSFEKEKEMESNLNNLKDFISNFNQKKIQTALMKPEDEYATMINLVGMTNFTVQTVYLEAIDLLKKLREFINASTNENDFKLLLDKIDKFDLSFNQEAITKLEEEIQKRKEKLTNVESILEKSKDNRMECNVLKIRTMQAKENATNLLSSIENIMTNYKNMENYKIKTKEILFNFSDILKDLKNQLLTIAKKQSQTGDKQNNIGTDIDKIIVIELRNKKSITNLSTNISQLQDRNDKNSRQLVMVETGIIHAAKTKNDIIQNNELSKRKFSQSFQRLFSRVQELNRKMKNSQERLTSVKQLFVRKQFELDNIGLEIDSKMNRLAVLQENIYSKSEFHAKCLP